MEEITFDEFKRMDLRVGEILEAKRVEGTQKLLIHLQRKLMRSQKSWEELRKHHLW